MAEFLCPVCGNVLVKTEKCYCCGNGHSFDIARQGYVNLMRLQQSSSKHHGDDKLMVAARRRFLDKGYYEPLRARVCEAAVKYSSDNISVLDAGCGEGWYTAGVLDALAAAGKHAEVIGIDISKEALKAAGVRCRELRLAAASVFDMPVGDASQDMVMNIFSPLADGEFRRVLRRGGILMRVVPDEYHLFGLKEKIYEHPYLNDAVNTDITGFELLEDIAVNYMLHLPGTDDITALFMMTPYYYKTGAEDQKKALHLESLDTDVCFRVLIYKRK